MNNAARIAQIRSLPPRQSYLGQIVSDGTHTGIVDAEFVDLEAATACGVVPQGWFEGLQKPGLSQKRRFVAQCRPGTRLRAHR
jgi:hypothetical protein